MILAARTRHCWSAGPPTRFPTRTPPARAFACRPSTPALSGTVGVFHQRAAFQVQRRLHQSRRPTKWTVVPSKPLWSDASPSSVLFGIIAANSAVTVAWQLKVKQRNLGGMVMTFVTSPEHVAAHQYHTLVTATFSHLNDFALAINMGGLWFFGREVCKVLGSRSFLRLYLTTSVLTSLAAVYQIKRTGKRGAYIGATSTVCAIAAVNALLNPRVGTILPSVLFGCLPICNVCVENASASELRSLNQWSFVSGAVSGGAYFAYLRLSRTLRHLR